MKEGHLCKCKYHGLQKKKREKGKKDEKEKQVKKYRNDSSEDLKLETMSVFNVLEVDIMLLSVLTIK